MLHRSATSEPVSVYDRLAIDANLNLRLPSSLAKWESRKRVVAMVDRCHLDLDLASFASTPKSLNRTSHSKRKLMTSPWLNTSTDSSDDKDHELREAHHHGGGSLEHRTRKIGRFWRASLSQTASSHSHHFLPLIERYSIRFLVIPHPLTFLSPNQWTQSRLRTFSSREPRIQPAVDRV